MDYFFTKLVASAGSVFARTRDKDQSNESEYDTDRAENETDRPGFRHLTILGNRSGHGNGQQAVPPSNIGRTALLLCVDALRTTTSFIYDSFQVADTAFEIGNDSITSDGSAFLNNSAMHETFEREGEVLEPKLSMTPVPIVTALGSSQSTSSTSSGLLSNRVSSPLLGSVRDPQLGSPQLSTLTPVYSDRTISEPDTSFSMTTESVPSDDRAEDGSQIDENNSHCDLSEMPLLQGSRESEYMVEETNEVSRSPKTSYIRSPLEYHDLFESPRTFRQGLSLNNKPVSMYSIGYQADSEGESTSELNFSSEESTRGYSEAAGVQSNAVELDNVFSADFLKPTLDAPIGLMLTELDDVQTKPSLQADRDCISSEHRQPSQIRYRQVDGKLVGPITVSKHERDVVEYDLSYENGSSFRVSALPSTIEEDFSSEISTARILVGEALETHHEDTTETDDYPGSFQNQLPGPEDGWSPFESLDLRSSSPPKDYFGNNHNKHVAQPSYSTPKRRAFRASSGIESLLELDPTKLLWRQDSKTRPETLRHGECSSFGSAPARTEMKSTSGNIVTCVCPTCRSPPIGDSFLKNYCGSCGTAVEWPVTVPLPNSRPASQQSTAGKSPKRLSSSPRKSLNYGSPLRDSQSAHRSPSKIPVSQNMLAEISAQAIERHNNTSFNAEDEQIWANGLTLRDMVNATSSKRRDKHSPTRY